jgi:hypothetical protein
VARRACTSRLWVWAEAAAAAAAAPLRARLLCMFRALLLTQHTPPGREGFWIPIWVCLGDGSTPFEPMYAVYPRVLVCVAPPEAHHRQPFTLWSVPPCWSCSGGLLLPLLCRARVCVLLSLSLQKCARRLACGGCSPVSAGAVPVTPFTVQLHHTTVTGALACVWSCGAGGGTFGEGEGGCAHTCLLEEGGGFF